MNTTVFAIIAFWRNALRTEEISRFFPYSGTWYRAYEVAFPLEAQDAPPPVDDYDELLSKFDADYEGDASISKLVKRLVKDNRDLRSELGVMLNVPLPVTLQGV